MGCIIFNPHYAYKYGIRRLLSDSTKTKIFMVPIGGKIFEKPQSQPKVIDLENEWEIELKNVGTTKISVKYCVSGDEDEFCPWETTIEPSYSEIRQFLISPTDSKKKHYLDIETMGEAEKQQRKYILKNMHVMQHTFTSNGMTELFGADPNDDIL